TGLNLQAADTVINLEVPWNPAVLEQRIARVHRMGQHRPVQVFHLVTRDSIEERVLRTLERQRELFAGVFTAGSDEVVVGALGQGTFLQAVRDLVEEGEPEPEPSPVVAAPQGEAGSALVRAGVQFLEALAAALADPEAPPLIGTDAKTGKPVLQLPLPSG